MSGKWRRERSRTVRFAENIQSTLQNYALNTNIQRVAAGYMSRKQIGGFQNSEMVGMKGEWSSPDFLEVGMSALQRLLGADACIHYSKILRIHLFQPFLIIFHGEVTMCSSDSSDIGISEFAEN